MGIFDTFIGQVNAIKRAAEAALELTRNLAIEAERKLKESMESVERLATDIKLKVENTAEELQCDLERLTPKFDNKLEEIIEQVTEVAKTAADEGVDVTEAIDGAVEVALKALEDTLKAAIDAINQFLDMASKKVFDFLGGFIPQFFFRPIQDIVELLLKKLASFGDSLKVGISYVVQQTKVAIQNIVKNIGAVLGPVWNFIKKLWKILFGIEPEQCTLTAAWFDERMKRTETQLLHRRSGEPVSALIKHHTFLELLPPSNDSWRQFVLNFLDQTVTTSIWSAHRASMQSLLTTSSPLAGSLIQLILDQSFTDRLGGHQCIQICVLYYRWRTEEFRKVSSGFLGILVMISAVGGQEEIDASPMKLIPREPPLQIDAATIKKIYSEIEPHLRLKLTVVGQELTRLGSGKKHTSQKLMSRDNNGVWRSSQVI